MIKCFTFEKEERENKNGLKAKAYDRAIFVLHLRHHRGCE
jgi:hypothetical protein